MLVQMQIPESLREVLVDLADRGMRPHLVGGCVRDHLLGKTPHDFDVVVDGATLQTLEDALGQHGRVGRDGASFLVLRLHLTNGDEFEFALPRVESHSGPRHNSLEVSQSSLAEDAIRRDVTINALMVSFPDMTLVDNVGGLVDLRVGVMRPCSEHFKDDWVRVFRVARQSARLGFSIHDDAFRMAREGVGKEANPTMVFSELSRLLCESERPSDGLRFLRDTGWLPQPLADLFGVPQDPGHHPEGDAGTHTFLVIDAAARISRRESLDDFDRLTLMWSAALHDIGKKADTKVVDGKVVSHGHEITSAKMAFDFLMSLTAGSDLANRVSLLCGEHMVFRHDGAQPTDRTVRRLSVRLMPQSLGERARGSFRLLALLQEADRNGRHETRPMPETAVRMVEIAASLQVVNAPPVWFVNGDDLLRMGMRQGPEIGRLLRILHDEQLDGNVRNRAEGLALAESMIGNGGF